MRITPLFYSHRGMDDFGWGIGLDKTACIGKIGDNIVHRAERCQIIGGREEKLGFIAEKDGFFGLPDRHLADLRFGQRGVGQHPFFGYAMAGKKQGIDIEPLNELFGEAAEVRQGILKDLAAGAIGFDSLLHQQGRQGNTVGDGGDILLLPQEIGDLQGGGGGIDEKDLIIADQVGGRLAKPALLGGMDGLSEIQRRNDMPRLHRLCAAVASDDPPLPIQLGKVPPNGGQADIKQSA